MYKFGKIEIPKSFFEAMVIETVAANLSELPQENVNSVLQEQIDAIYALESSNEQSVFEALNWLVRIYANDFVSSYQEIKQKPEYCQIDDAVEEEAKRRTYQILATAYADQNIMQSADIFFQELEADKASSRES